MCVSPPPGHVTTEQLSLPNCDGIKGSGDGDEAEGKKKKYPGQQGGRLQGWMGQGAV